jgi:tol-pal system protein YbgF
MRAAALLLGCALTLPGAPAAAQGADGDTLADIRQQLAVLQVELSAMTRELSTTGAPGVNLPGASAGVLERVDAIEAELRRLTAATEAAQFRIERIARDGGNRMEDLRFQLSELTPDCDIATLPAPAPLGEAAEGTDGAGPGGAATVEGGSGRPVPRPAQGESAVGLGTLPGGPEAVTPVAPATPAPAGPGAPAAPEAAPELALGEQAEFDAARAALDAGLDREAADGFGRFVESYPTGPLTVEAHYFRGEALARSGETQAAARSYLEAFSGAPEGPRAAEALLGLGRSLGALGQSDEACLTLQEVEARFPGSPAVPEAQGARASLNCP